jgi:hypothetical protein
VTQQPGPHAGEPYHDPAQSTVAPSGPVVTPGQPAHPGYLAASEPVPALPGAGLRPVGVPFQPAPVPPPPADGRWVPERVDPVAGTEFGLVRLQVPPVASGLATGSMMAGIASILVSFLVLCFGLAGSSAGWGGWVAGAFALLGVLFGGGAAALGFVALRQIRRSAQPGRMRFTGRGRAIAGISCGFTGAGISLVSLALGLMLQLS